MQQPVVGLREPLAQKVMRQMAVVTGCYRMMTGFYPGIIVPLHDMTVGTSRWVIGEIGGTAPIAERKQPQPTHNTEQAASN